jgi:hypothetical protein
MIPLKELAYDVQAIVTRKGFAYVIRGYHKPYYEIDYFKYVAPDNVQQKTINLRYSELSKINDEKIHWEFFPMKKWFKTKAVMDARMKGLQLFLYSLSGELDIRGVSAPYALSSSAD